MFVSSMSQMWWHSDRFTLQVAAGKLPAIVEAVLGVRVTPSTVLNQSNWASRPLSAGQAHYTMQSAWLHAHLMDCLGNELGWQTAALDACVVTAQL